MNEPNNSDTTRRNVLKTAGAVGLLSLAGAGTVAAKNGDAKNNKDIDAFLNKPAAYKDGPIWDGVVVDATGMSEVTVVNGAMTSVNIPDEPIPMAPVAFAPQAIRVSPGTSVTWTWPVYPDPVPAIPHDVVARRTVEGEPMFDSGLRFPGDENFTYTFDEVGEYLYYCTPHGAPFAVESFLGGKVNNEFGMRGAVIVID